MRTKSAIGLTLLLVILGGCGGGGDGGPAACQVGVSTMAFPDGCPVEGASGTLGVASLGLSVKNSAGTVIAAVSPEQTGTVHALVRDAKGNVAPNVAVTFLTSDKTGTFVPSSGTALTDSAGVARVDLPIGTQAGAFTVTANATVGGASTKGAVDYAVTFPTLTLSPLRINPGTLSSGGNASVSVTVMIGTTPYTPPIRVAFTSPCIATGKATMGVPVLTQNGVASTSYSDKGCGVADVITATATIGDLAIVQTGAINVLPAAAGSLKFLSANTTNIALKGTGGFGRQESATLTFEVYDTTGNKVAGSMVDFMFSDSNASQTVGGLTLNPSFATSDADGRVTTLVTAGTIPTSARVVATLRNSSPPLTTLSNILVVSTGVPDQKHFSLSTSIGNCEGRDFDQVCSTVTAILADHFGNAVPDGTAVNFSSEGGKVDASCVTGSLPPAGATPPDQTTNSKVGPGSGSCSVLLFSSAPRAANGRVTVLAYALGEEDFFDSNGNNYFDAGEPFTDKRPDIYRDDDESGAWNPGEACLGPDPTLACTAKPGDNEYNGVLRVLQQPRPPQTVYVSGQLVQTFSGSDAIITYTQPSLACPSGRTADVQVKVTDVNGNIMPAGTLIDFSTLAAAPPHFPVNPSSVTVNNVVLAVGEQRPVPTYTVTVGCLAGNSGTFFVKVTTPNKIVTSSSILINP